MRYSKQRETILQAVRDNKIHPTADQVYKLVRKENPTISLGTVYRDLNQLVEAQEILRLRISGSKDRFDADTSEHYHFLCTKCACFKDIPKDLAKTLKDLLLQINEQIAVTVSPTSIQFEGVCVACKRQEENKNQEDVMEQLN